MERAACLEASALKTDLISIGMAQFFVNREPGEQRREKFFHPDRLRTRSLPQWSITYLQLNSFLLISNGIQLQSQNNNKKLCFLLARPVQATLCFLIVLDFNSTFINNLDDGYKWPAHNVGVSGQSAFGPLRKSFFVLSTSFAIAFDYRIMTHNGRSQPSA